MAQEWIHQLDISGPENSRQTFILPPGLTIIGRSADNDLVLPHHFVSNRHAQIECTPTGCQITDLKSTNDTYVNGEKLAPHVPVALRDKMVIQIGPFQLTFRQTEVEAQPAPPRPQRPASNGFNPIDLERRSQYYLHYLPDIYHTDFMARFLALFESILTPIKWNVDNFDLYLDPRTAPAEFLPWLANWFEIAFDSTWSVVQQRALLAEAHKIYERRGTRWALARVLEIYTGVMPIIRDLEEGEDPFTFTVELALSERNVDRTLIERIIDSSKPAHTSYKLLFTSRS